MTNTHATATDLLDKTLAALTTDLNTADKQAGSTVLGQWSEMLRAGENTRGLADTLDTLKTQLAADQPDAAQIGQLLTNLADQTRQFSTTLGAEGDLAPRLEALSSTLRTAAGQAT